MTGRPEHDRQHRPGPLLAPIAADPVTIAARFLSEDERVRIGAGREGAGQPLPAEVGTVTEVPKGRFRLSYPVMVLVYASVPL